MDKKIIIERLKKVKDPEMGIDIVNLGLLRDLKIEGNKLFVFMTLTTAGCPLASYFVDSIKELFSKDFNDVEVKFVFDKPWSYEDLSEEAKIILGLF
jgi:metal-sulfur cluster biosynthetic enzyme